MRDRPGGGWLGGPPPPASPAPSPPVGWPVEHLRGDAAELHDRGLPALPALPAPGSSVASVEVLSASGPALVLGSTQPSSVADEAACAAAGVAVVRRRSGGGVVLVGPGECLWVDVLLPVGHVSWVDDVSSSAWWLGEAWADALADVGVAGAVVHHGAVCVNRWGRLVCFAGLGGGEVTIGDGGPKVVGIAQRRGRWGARFQCAVPLRWDAERLVSLLAWPSPTERAAALDDLAVPGLVAPLDPSLAEPLVDALLARLPDLAG
jgi:lipoate-protein ligase A